MKKYSIILPVKNGGEYVKECVNSILSQSLNEFNLIVLDNYSTDGTLQWIESLQDERIELHRSDKPLSIEENWGRIVSVKKNEFITLIGHDDILYKNYLETIDILIDKFPDASLHQTHFNFINSKGKEIRKSKPMPEVISASEFFQLMLKNNIDLMGTGFMMRSKQYDDIGGIPDYPNLLFADFELWINLSRTNYVAVAQKECFSFRIHQSTTSNSPDVKMQQAFDRLIYFFKDLKKDDALKNVIQQNAVNFIATYCKGLSHRLLRTPVSKRNGLSVKKFLQKCKEYADMLVPGNKYEPTNTLSVRIAKIFDSSSVGRNLFLAFKKIYKKPVLK